MSRGPLVFDKLLLRSIGLSHPVDNSVAVPQQQNFIAHVIQPRPPAHQMLMLPRVTLLRDDHLSVLQGHFSPVVCRLFFSAWCSGACKFMRQSSRHLPLGPRSLECVGGFRSTAEQCAAGSHHTSAPRFSKVVSLPAPDIPEPIGGQTRTREAGESTWSSTSHTQCWFARPVGLRSLTTCSSSTGNCSSATPFTMLLTELVHSKAQLHREKGDSVTTWS